jgi:predicted DNA-binding antitoxin AbrB/MazE fold protein
MAMSVEATYENGVFVPTERPILADHERVRLTVEPISVAASGSQVIRRRRERRIHLAPGLAQEIAKAAEFAPEEA